MNTAAEAQYGSFNAREQELWANQLSVAVTFEIYGGGFKPLVSNLLTFAWFTIKEITCGILHLQWRFCIQF